MTKKNNLNRFFSTVLFVTAIVVSACSHQARNSDEFRLSAEGDDTRSEETIAKETSGETAPAAEDAVKNSEEFQPVASNNTPTDTTGSNSGAGNADAALPAGDNSSSPALLLDGAAAVPNEAATGAALSPVGEVAQVDTNSLPLTTQPSSPLPTEMVAPSAQGTEPELSSMSDNRDVKSLPKKRRGLKSPRIPSEGFLRSNQVMNRYYFLRQGDNADSVSEMIYGSKDRANDLAAWNNDVKWEAGQIVYFQSPVQADDKVMHSLYEDTGVGTEQYAVKPGDTLKSIAKTKYGTESSWAEIAALNGISKGGTLEKGRLLAIYPEKLSGYPKAKAEEAVAKPTEATRFDAAPAIKVDADKPATTPGAPNASVDNAVTTAMSAAKADEDDVMPNSKSKDQPALASAEIAKFFENNLMLTLGMGLALIAVGFLFWKKAAQAKENSEF